MATMIGDYLTVSELADQMGLTPQRVHVILRTYDVPTIRPHKRLTLVPKAEAKKLLKLERPNGKHIEK
jgi:hypothetical protein